MKQFKQSEHHLEVNIQLQQMFYFINHKISHIYPISTAKNGIGCEKNSFQTPLGWHIIRAKIGSGVPKWSIFKGRRVQPEKFDPQMLQKYPGKDWILTRILWLSGLEVGVNRLGNVDTMSRYIYIHGMAEEEKVGKPNSKGCINMLNNDIIDLFDSIPVYATVYIKG